MQIITGHQVTGSLRDMTFTGTVVAEYSVSIHGFEVPMVAVECTDGRTRYMLRGHVTRLVPAGHVTARQAVPGTQIEVKGGFGAGIFSGQLFSQIVVGSWEAVGGGLAQLRDVHGTAYGMFTADHTFLVLNDNAYTV